jgi:hypothetical protein
MKRCSKCGSGERTPDDRCRPCRLAWRRTNLKRRGEEGRKKRREYYAKTMEVRRKNSRESYQRHRERRVKDSQEYYLRVIRNGVAFAPKSKEQLSANRKARYLKDYEILSKRCAEYRERNREKCREDSARHVRGLTDHYIKMTLGVKSPPQALIELKRIQIKILRATR